jgi:hypothetical protein
MGVHIREPGWNLLVRSSSLFTIANKSRAQSYFLKDAKEGSGERRSLQAALPRFETLRFVLERGSKEKLRATKDGFSGSNQVSKKNRRNPLPGRRIRADFLGRYPSERSKHRANNLRLPRSCKEGVL